MAELDEQSRRFSPASLLPPRHEDAEGTVVSAHVAPDLLDQLDALVEHNRTVRNLDANATIDAIFRCGVFAYARMLDKAGQPAGAPVSA